MKIAAATMMALFGMGVLFTPQAQAHCGNCPGDAPAKEKKASCESHKEHGELDKAIKAPSTKEVADTIKGYIEEDIKAKGGKYLLMDGKNVLALDFVKVRKGVKDAGEKQWKVSADFKDADEKKRVLDFLLERGCAHGDRESCKNKKDCDKNCKGALKVASVKVSK